MTLEQWIQNNIQFRQHNVRPWGTYELLVSQDRGVSWNHFSRPFGSRITENEAFQMVLTEMLRDDKFRTDLSNWLGEQRATELFAFFDPPTPEVTESVSEHIHHEPNAG